MDNFIKDAGGPGWSCQPGPWGYRSYRQHLSDRFGPRRIRKCCLQAGFTCPNLDGRRGRGGCTWCNNAGFAPRLAEMDPNDLRAQWDRGRACLRRRHRRVDGFIAYFQSYSNTYAPAEVLARLYDPLPQSLPECVGVAIGTRPDCLEDGALEVVADLAARTWTVLELGLQSDRDEVLTAHNRGHGVAETLAAVHRAAACGVEVCLHVILGLPGEGEDAPERLGRLLADLPVASCKIHNLHILRGTALARAGCRPPERAAYLDAVARLIARLRPDQAVQRVLADAPDRLLLGSPWCQDKQGFLADLADRLSARSTSCI